ncbi:MAG: hypothetical protein R6V50_03120 [Thermoplasmatota archaeon]
MNDDDKKELLDEFVKGDGAKRLDLWDYALSQQVLWDQIITELTIIAKKQGVDKKLEKMAEEELSKLDKE